MSTSTTQATGPYIRLTRRGKFAAAIVALLLLAILFTVVWNQLAGPQAVATDDQPETYQQIVIQPGDTLWGIAVRVSQQTQQDKALDDIVAYNDLDSSELEVGQTLYIPVGR